MKLNVIVKMILDDILVEKWNVSGLLRGMSEYEQKVLANLLDNHTKRMMSKL